mmetsp:Transcript_3033/g.14329  ORF Transcript_3033/g.14329 Transcript_3033/m.14329 type:complete len:109 (-) Transcript_3033:1084-1410(-)
MRPDLSWLGRWRMRSRLLPSANGSSGTGLTAWDKSVERLAHMKTTEAGRWIPVLSERVDRKLIASSRVILSKTTRQGRSAQEEDEVNLPAKQPNGNAVACVSRPKEDE